MGLDTVELLQTLENHFGIEISYQDAEKIITVGDLQQTVWQYLQLSPPDSPLSRAEIDAVIVQIIADFAGLDSSEVTPPKSITSDLGLD